MALVPRRLSQHAESTDATCTMPRHLHRDSFGHTGADHVSDCRPSEIVEQAGTNLRRLTRRRPCLTEVTDHDGAAGEVMVDGERRAGSSPTVNVWSKANSRSAPDTLANAYGERRQALRTLQAGRCYPLGAPELPYQRPASIRRGKVGAPVLEGWRESRVPPTVRKPYRRRVHTSDDSCRNERSLSVAQYGRVNTVARSCNRRPSSWPSTGNHRL